MIVYIEQVLIDNLIVNFLLLYLSNKLILKNFKFYRILLADLLGTFCAVIFPFFEINGFMLLTVKILLGIVMILIGCRTKNFKQFICCFFTFLFLTAIMGGLAFAIILGVYPQTVMTDGMLMYQGMPMGIVLLISFILLKLFYNLIIVIKKKSMLEANICNLELLNDNNKIKVSAYIDSGNLLTFDEKPVILISFPTFKKLYKITNEDFLKSNYNITNSKYINTQTPNGDNKLLVFDIDEILLVEKSVSKKLDCSLGLTLSNIENKFGCNALIGSIALK